MQAGDFPIPADAVKGGDRRAQPIDQIVGRQPEGNDLGRRPPARDEHQGTEIRIHREQDAPRPAPVRQDPGIL